MGKQPRSRMRLFGIILCGLGALLIAAAALLLVYNAWLEEHGGDQSAEILPELKLHIEEAAELTQDQLEQSSATITIDGYEYIGYLSIPDLGLELPVMSSWSLEQLGIAPCRYEGDVASNNLVICAHRWKAHFGRLKDLELGAALYFTNVLGETVAYEAVSSQVLEPYNIEDMIVSDYDLTLFTCTYSGQTRFVLRCMRT